VSVEVRLPPATRVRLVGFKEAAGPFGDTRCDRVIVPVKPPRLVSVIVEVLDEPGESCNVEGLDEMVKSGATG
jgi:hypothetical protein